MDEFLSVIIILIGVAIITSGITMHMADASWRDQVVEHGCAEFYLDQDHQRQWRWK